MTDFSKIKPTLMDNVRGITILFAEDSDVMWINDKELLDRAHNTVYLDAQTATVLDLLRRIRKHKRDAQTIFLCFSDRRRCHCFRAIFGKRYNYFTDFRTPDGMKIQVIQNVRPIRFTWDE